MSSSSNGRHYRGGHYGSGHYQKKGLLGGLFDMLGSRSRSHSSHYYRQQNTSNQYPETNKNFAICTKCHSQIPAGSKFCLECGERVVQGQFCLECGEQLPANAKFCMKCGKKV